MHTWRTDELPAGEQFSYWREVICEAFTPLSPRQDRSSTGQAGLRGWVRSAPLQSTNCAAIGSSPQRHVHGDAEVRRTSADSMFVNLMLSGECIGRQGGRTCTIKVGEFAVFDATEPFSLDYIEDWEVLSFRLPREKLLPLLPRADKATAVTHTRARAATAVVTSMMKAAWDVVDGLDRSTAAAMDDAFASVLAAAAGSATDFPEQRREDVDAALRAAINRHVLAHLQRGDLSTRAVAAHFDISIRKLHALYERQPLSYAQQVRRTRVDACAREIADDHSKALSLTATASRWGFSDLSHLNRVFKAELGCLPSDYRAGAARGLSARTG